MHKVNLIGYVIGVAIVWAVILCAAWLFDGGAHLKTLALVCGGFAIAGYVYSRARLQMEMMFFSFAWCRYIPQSEVRPVNG